MKARAVAETVVPQLVEAGADVDAQDESGWTPLHVAVSNANSVMLNVLIEAGADVNRRNELGNTPLYYAAFTDEDPIVAALLIERGAERYLVHKAGEGSSWPWYRSEENIEALSDLRSVVQEALGAEDRYGEPRAVALCQDWWLAAESEGTVTDGFFLKARLWAPNMMPKGSIMDVIANPELALQIGTVALDTMPGRRILGVLPAVAFTVSTFAMTGSPAAPAVLETTLEGCTPPSGFPDLRRLAKEAGIWQRGVAWTWLDLIGWSSRRAVVSLAQRARESTSQ